MSDTPPPTMLPCGCRLEPAVIDGDRTLIIHACRAGCRNLANALGLADDLGKPVEIREVS